MTTVVKVLKLPLTRKFRNWEKIFKENNIIGLYNQSFLRQVEKKNRRFLKKN